MDKLTFKEIADKIQTVEAIRWVDFDLGQLEQEKPPVSYPCALIRFDSASYINLTTVSQQGELRVTIRLAFNLFERTHSKADAAKRDQALTHMDAVQDVHAALQGLNGTNFTALSRVAFATETRADLRVYALTYTTLVTDDGTDSDGDGGGGNGGNYVPWSEIPTAAPALCLDEDIEK